MMPSLTNVLRREATEPIERGAFAVVGVYGLLHAFIDASTVTALYRAGIATRLGTTLALIATYNLLAFALQAVLGPLVDALRAPRLAGIVGTLMSLTALLLVGKAPAFVVVAICGVGNALFHLGGGAISLVLAPRRSVLSGVFVAPGALGLATGIWLGHQPKVTVMPLLVALCLALVVQLVVTVPATPASDSTQPTPVAPLTRFSALLALALLLGTVLVRSLVGSGAAHALPRSVALSFAIAGAAFLGKLMGGFVADRIGWVNSSVGALLVSIPLLVLGEKARWAVVAGMLVFQTTMPVTLSAASLLFPKRPATSFGLCCLALVGGAAITWNPLLRALSFDGRVFAALIALSAVGVGLGLRQLGARVPTAHGGAMPESGSPREVAKAES